MNKKSYYRDLINFRNSLDSDAFNTLIGVVEIFEGIHVVSSNLNFRLFTVSDQDSTVRQEKSKVVDAVNKAISTDKAFTKMRYLNRCTMEIEDLVHSVIQNSPSESKVSLLLNDFLDNMETFLDQHELYRVNFAPQSVYELSFASHKLLLSLKGLELAIDTVLQNYLSDSSKDEELNYLELYLSHVPSLKQFGLKLQVIDEMYHEISNLCDFSLADHPIVIEHIENGSLLARVSGHPLVVGILLQILGSSATYFIAKYPIQNEMVEMKETVATLDDMFELSKKLEAEGYEVDKMQESIHRTLKKVAHSSEILFADQPTIEINDNVYNLDDKNQLKLIEESKRKLLENKASALEII